MYGLVLEGGGARGAYQVGAIKALLENGYEISSVVGTSIGAINGAMIAQGDFDKLLKLWKSASFSTLMDIDETKLDRLIKRNIDFGVIKYISTVLKSTLSSGGIDTLKMKELFEEYIDEDKVRNSNIHFGLVTVCLTDKKNLELFIEAIPKGDLIEYLLASSRLPVFKSRNYQNKHYIDGGVYNNCPANMLEKENCEEVIVIRTNSKGKIKTLKNLRAKNVKITIIKPVDELPGIINFNNKGINKMIDLGYYDALKIIKKLDGYRSYLIPITEEKAFAMLCKLSNKNIEKLAEILGIESENYGKMLLFEKIIPRLYKKLGYKNLTGYKSFIYAMLEHVAVNEDINLFNIYEFEDFLKLVKENIKLRDKLSYDKAIYTFAKYLSI